MKKNKSQAMALLETMYDPRATGCWSDLNELTAQANNLMLGMAQVAPILRNKELCAFVPDQKGLLSTAQMIANDGRAFRGELDALTARHKGRTGGSVNPDELSEALQLGMEYTDWIERYQSTVLPNLGMILDYAIVGAKALDAANKESAARIANAIVDGAVAVPVTEDTAAPVAEAIPVTETEVPNV